MSGSDTQAAIDPFIEITFDPPPSGTVHYLFDGLKGEEELGRPFLITLDLSSGTQNDTTQLIGASCTIKIKRTTDDSSPLYFNGVVATITSSGMVSGAYHYQVQLRPWIWLLTRVTDCYIFQNKSPFDIITAIFNNNGFSSVYSDNRQASAGSTSLEYCVQYKETSFEFVTRLMEKYGIYYFFKHENNKHTLVLCDDPNSHTSVGAAIPFQPETARGRVAEDHIWEWVANRSLESAKVTYQDYNFETPTNDLTSKSIGTPPQNQYNSFEVYEYPGIYDTTDNGSKMTDIRLQSIAWKQTIYSATSNARALHAGSTFTLSGATMDSDNADYTIIKSEFAMSMAEGSATSQDQARTVDTYRVKATSIPKATHYRLDHKTRIPMIRGPQTAVVAGESGQEIDPDKYGRVKVHFYWDRGPDAASAQPSCWIRVAQVTAGQSWGSIYIPRIGQEVVVIFLEGNPDRPLITGVVYNAQQTVPYSLPDNKTQSGIKTNSSMGGGGSNEFRLEDKKGSEEVYFHAQKDYKKEVEHDETVTIKTGNRTHTVQQGDDSTTVSQGKSALTVSAGNHTIDVSAGTSAITAAQSITLTVGANSIKIDTSGITMNGAQIQATATGSMSVTAPSVSTTASGSFSVTSPSISLA